MKHLLLITVLVAFTFTGNAQYSRHIIQLTDKNGSSFNFKDPTSFISRKALDRRIKAKADIDSTDLPVSRIYLDSIRLAGSVRIISVSKWLNQVLIQTTDAAALNKISNFPFVKRARPIANRNTNRMAYEDKFGEDDAVTIQQPGRTRQQSGDAFSYGQAYKQIHIHNGEYLHNKGFTGKGVTIAVLDAGFFNYTGVKAFDSLRANNQILGIWDYVANEESVDEDHPHGMYCFSIMAANEPGKYVGSAPKASYYLFRTEDAATEFPIEEHNWVVAAEKADSAGADIISSSLGYYLFDDPSFNHSYADMNGDKTMITIGADMAAKKGMIVCNSAGNEGGGSWRYIIAPADGDSVLAIGAVNVDSIPGGFSSFGPSSDGRVKPDVASVGVDTWVVATDGNLGYGSGTSFANPNLAGLIACLWQAFPEFGNMEIIEAVKKSAHQYNNPDARVGYGIPDMQKAYDMLMYKRKERILKNDWAKPYPNPFVSQVNVIIKAQESGELSTQLSDMNGRVLHITRQQVVKDQIYTITIDQAGRYPAGAYHMKVSNGSSSTTVRLVK